MAKKYSARPNSRLVFRRFASIYGIVGIILVPINYYVIEVFANRSMHPENLERGSLGDGMGLPFLVGNLTLFAAFAYLVLQRWEVEGLRARAALLAANAREEEPQ